MKKLFKYIKQTKLGLVILHVNDKEFNNDYLNQAVFYEDNSPDEFAALMVKDYPNIKHLEIKLTPEQSIIYLNGKETETMG